MIRKTDIMFVLGLGIGVLGTILGVLVAGPVGQREIVLGVFLLAGMFGLCTLTAIMNRNKEETHEQS